MNERPRVGKVGMTWLVWAPGQYRPSSSEHPWPHAGAWRTWGGAMVHAQMIAARHRQRGSLT